MAYARESIELTPVGSVDAGDGPVSVPDAALLFASEFQRAGSDLKLVSDDGGDFLVTNYFATSTPPSLVAPNNASLDGGTVGLLAGPAYPGQYAQAGPAAKVEAIGKVETLEGSVTAQRADGTTHQLQAGDPVFESDVISTGESAVLGIRFVDGTVLSLQESGKLVLNKFVYAANGSDNAALLNILEGTFSLFAGEVAPTGDMKIQTPIATMGIRGTSILGVNVSTLAGRLSLTQDPNNHVGFVEVFNNLNGDLFTVLRAIFNKVTLTEAGLLALSAKTPDELAFDLNLTQALHDFYENLGPPQAGPDPQGQPLTGSPFFQAPTFQEIDFGNPVDPDGETITIPPELLIQFLEFLLQDPRIQNAIINALQETAPSAGDLDLEALDEVTGVGEGSEVDSSLPFSFGSSGPGAVGFANLDGEPVLDANGNPVTTGGEPLVYVWDATTNTLTAVIPGVGDADDTPIFTIEVNPSTGAITVTIVGAVDHLGLNDLQLSVDLQFTVTAANGQTATGELTIVIDDAVPSIEVAGGEGLPILFADDDIDTDNDPDNASFAGLFATSFGADGAGTITYALDVSAPDADSGLVDSETGEAVVLNVSADGLTVTGTTETTGLPVFTITVDADGVITFTGLRAIIHDDPNDPDEDLEETAEMLLSPSLVTLTATITDADGDTESATAEIGNAFKFEDAGPTASNNVATVVDGGQQAINFAFIVDISGSMNNNPGVQGFASRLALAQEALRQLLASANVNQVMVVAFESTATVLAWTDPASALTFINNLATSGSTNYEAAIDALIQNWDEGPTDADQTFVYFLSDGAPDPQSGVDADQQAALEQFFADEGVDEAFAIGIGDGAGTAELEPIAWQPDNPASDPIIVTDEAQLIATLNDTLPDTVAGNVLTDDSGDGADSFGADGMGGILSIEVDGVTYTYDPESDAISNTGGDATNLGDGTLQVLTLLGGTLIFHFVDDGQAASKGDWEYTAPAGTPALPYENIRYTIFDADEDASTASLTIVLDPSAVDEVIQGDGGDNILGAEPEPMFMALAQQMFLVERTAFETPGHDVLVGGPGSDTFVVDDLYIFDYIADYEFGEGDQIDLSALLDGNNLDLNSDVQLINNGPGAVDALKVDTGDGFATVALLNGDAGVNIIVDDSTATVPPPVA